MGDLNAFLLSRADAGLVSWASQVEAAQRYRRSIPEIEEAVLSRGLLPARYQRNRETVSLGQQMRLFRSRVAVVGAGGLGGYVIEELARLGVGCLVVVDPDVFEEHNLNRQLLSTPAALGRPKADVAAERILEINPAVAVVPLQRTFRCGDAGELVQGADAVVDGLDSVTSRLELARACRELRIPLVHGAIAGWYGQVATQLPGDDLTPYISGAAAEARGIESGLGNPAFTPAVVASLQAAEVCKVLLSEGRCLSRRILFVNLLSMEFDEIAIPGSDGIREG